MLGLLLIAALTMQELPQSFLDQKVRDGKPLTGTALDEMTMGQMLKLTSLPATRLSQMQCTGYGLWRLKAGRPVLVKERLAELQVRLGMDAARFAGMTPVIGEAFVELYGEEAEAKEKELPAAEFKTWQASEDRRCEAFFRAAADGSLKHRPLAPSSVIDPRLSGCHALYRAAAERATGEEKAALTRDAERARSLALAGKQGAALTEAEAALAAEAEEAVAAPRMPEEPEMMQLVLCQPRLRDAK